MNPRIRPRRPPSIGSNQASPENSPCSAVALLLSLSMAWSPPALERRSWLVEQAGDYATQISHHTRDGTPRPARASHTREDRMQFHAHSLFGDGPRRPLTFCERALCLAPPDDTRPPPGCRPSPPAHHASP